MSSSTGPPLAALLDTGDPDELFELIDEIAQGSYGHVFNAVYLPKKQPCALKIIALEEDETFDDLKVEIALLKQCSHSKIVEFIGAWQKGEELFIAMELCDGASIDRILEARGAGLTEPELAALTKDSLEGLAYLHAQHTLHRDIKSANLLLNAKGECKLVDFGVSVISEPGVKRMTFIGSPYWMAPEVIDNRTLPSPYDAKCDVWSMGVTLIEMAENCVPLSDLQPMVALRQIPSREPPQLADKSAWSAEFNDFLQKCLQKDPDDRQSCAELLEHPWLQKGRDRSVLVALTKEYLAAQSDSEVDTDEDLDDDDTQGTSETEVSSIGLPEMPPVPTGQAVVVAPRETNEAIAAKASKRDDIDQDDKDLILSTLEEAKKKNRPTSLRRSTVEQDKFVAQVRNQQVLKEQLKMAKKRQQKSEGATKALLKQQDSEIKELEKAYKSRINKAGKQDTSEIRGTAEKAHKAMEKMKKAQSEAIKALSKQCQAELKDVEKSFSSVRSVANKQLKSLTTSAQSSFKTQCKAHLKDKAVKKKITQGLHKEQERELTRTITNLERSLQATQDGLWADIHFNLATFQEQRKTAQRMRQVRLANLRELHNLQRSALLELHIVMDSQAVALAHNSTVSNLELEHLAALHALRLEQVQTANAAEFDDHKKSAEVEHKRLMREFRLGLKKEVKDLMRLTKGTLKRAKGADKARIKAELEAKKLAMKAAHNEKSSQFEARIAGQVDDDLKQLVEYHKDQVERLKDFQTRELAKAQKAQERRLANLADEQAAARSDQAQSSNVDAFRFYLEILSKEQHLLQESQAQELGVTSRDFREGTPKKRGSSAGLNSGPVEHVEGGSAAERTALMRDRHEKIRAEFETEQKETFAHAFELTDNEQLLELVWCARNSKDVAGALLGMVPKPDVPMLTSEAQRADLRAQFEARQLEFAEAQNQHYQQISQQLEQSQAVDLASRLERAESESTDFVAQCGANLQQLMAAFDEQFGNLK